MWFSVFLFKTKTVFEFVELRDFKLKSLIMTNKEFQRLGKVSRVIGVYVLDDLGERIRRLPEGSEEHSNYKPEELEIVMKKTYDTKNIFIDTEPCLF